MTHRRLAARLLLLMASAIAITSLFWAWATFSYWESGPLVGTVASTGILGGFGLYLGRRRVLPAIVFGVVLSLLLLVAVFSITTVRWTR